MTKEKEDNFLRHIIYEKGTRAFFLKALQNAESKIICKERNIRKKEAEITFIKDNIYDLKTYQVSFNIIMQYMER